MAANTGRTAGADAGLTTRAARFAALGDPVRLAIAEHLALGDAAPGELGTLVDLPSNHLAFHLRVLREAGIVRTVRSEGDRRRSYVRLRLDDPAVAALVRPPAVALAERLGGTPDRVVFVCTHNSARSRLAAAAWARAGRLPATSAGTHPTQHVHPRTVTTARRHGLALRGTRTRHLDDTAGPGDLLVAVCDNAYEELTPARAASSGSAVVRLHWSVPDPARTDTDAAFDAAYADLVRRVDRLAGALAAVTTDPAPAGPPVSPRRPR